MTPWETLLSECRAEMLPVAMLIFAIGIGAASAVGGLVFVLNQVPRIIARFK